AAARSVVGGSLPARAGARAARRADLAGEPRALVFFEAARRLPAFLAAAATALGDRETTIARELTKQHEELLRGTLGDLAEHAGRVERLRGEVTVVIAGAPAGEQQVDDAELDGRIRAA